MKIKQEDGTEIEVFTADELKAEREKAAEEARSQAKKEAEGQVNDLNTKLTDAQKKLDDAEKSGNTAQIERLRKERDDAKKERDDAVAGRANDVKALREEIMGDTVTDLLKAYSGGDKDFSDKLKLEFDNYKPNETSKAAIYERMEKAYTIVKGQKPAPNLLDSIGGFGGSRGEGGAPKAPGQGLTENGNKIAKALGITDEMKKTAEKVTGKNY